MSHTPGPWRTDRNDIHSGQISVVHHCVGNDWVEVWSPDAIAADQKEMEANARLIAAAPELLEALEELYHLIDDAHDGDRVFTLELAQKAKAAIEKARGQG
jgi:hypothetical protein